MEYLKRKNNQEIKLAVNSTGFDVLSSCISDHTTLNKNGMTVASPSSRTHQGIA